jgi:hypothetical protein
VLHDDFLLFESCANASPIGGAKQDDSLVRSAPATVTERPRKSDRGRRRESEPITEAIYLEAITSKFGKKIS